MDSHPRPTHPVHPVAAAHAAPLTNFARIERISEPWSLNRTFAIAITLVLAMFLGSWVAAGQFENLILLTVWGVATGIVVFVQDHWWSPMLVISALCFTTTAMGFPFGGMEIGIVILSLTFPVKMAMKILRKAEPEMDPGILYWLLLGYVCVHCVLILGYEHIEGVVLRNIVRSYFNAIVPLIFYGMLIRYATSRTVKPAVIAIFFAFCITVFFAVITVNFGLNIEPFSDLRVDIGWLNQAEAAGNLRHPPLYLFIGSLAFWPTLRRSESRVFLGFVIAISAFGIIESGGRLALLTAAMCAIVYAFFRRGLWLALPVIVGAALVSAIITATPDILDPLPSTVQRGLSPFNYSDRGADAREALQGSDNYHRDLFNKSLTYWTSDTVSFLVGHGFKPWDYELDKAENAGDVEHWLDVAIGMGGTENMFSAITNIFGLAGLLLYGAFLINLAWTLWRASHLCPDRSPERALCEFSLILLVAALGSCPFQGGIPNYEIVYWMIGLLAARPYLVAASARKAAPALTAPERPAFAKPAYAEQVARSRPRRIRPARA